ncbi:MAG: hypothetical protein ACLP5V_06465 [Candidatus Bathyarchaeia archaeon]
MRRFGSVGLLLVVTAFLAISTVPGAVGVVISDVRISLQQGSGTVMVTVLNCAGNPVQNAPVQLRSLTWDQWTYTGPNGVATLSAPAGTYTLQGGINAYPFSQTINLGTGVVSVTVRLGAGCSISSAPTQTVIIYTSNGVTSTYTP